MNKLFVRVKEYVNKKGLSIHPGMIVGTGVVFAALFAFLPSLVFSASSNAGLANVPVGTAHYLGFYRPTELVGCDTSTEHITDYSRFSYDSLNNQMLMFGGGHASTPRDDVDVLNLNGGSSLTWNSAYASTPIVDMTEANFDQTTGAWISTGHPRTRHTYDMMPFIPDTGELTLLLPTGLQSNCEVHPVEGDAFWAAHPGLGWAYNPTTKVWRTLPVDTEIWYAHDNERPAAEYDPVSHKVIILSRSALSVYNPLNETGAKVKDISMGELSFAQNLVYFPPNGKMYYINTEGSVFEVTLDRNNFSNSTIVQMTGITGTGPVINVGDPGWETGWAYDSTNQIIGGGVNNSIFYAFDPVAKTWTAATMTSDTVGKTIGTQSTHALDYDPVDNVFIFLSVPAGQGIDQQATWAYRYGNGPSDVAPPVTDTTPPSVPSGLSASVISQTQINLSWSASTDNVGVTGYKVYRDGSLVATLAGTSYNDSSLTAGTTYTYTVAAYDASNNTSAQSSGVNATTQSSSTPPSAPIVSFSASPTTVVTGQTTTLTWSSTGATSCTGTGFTAGNTSGSVIDTPSTTTTYTVTCSGAGGDTSQSVTVTVAQAIQNISVSGSDFSQTNNCSSILAGQSCTATITFTPSTTGTRSGTFSFFDTESSTTQTVSLTGLGVDVAPTATLSTSASSINQGDSATLTWGSTNATSCVGTNFTAGATSGTASVSPSTTTTYTVTCTGTGGSANQSVTITVGSTPPVTIPPVYKDGQQIIPAAALHVFDSTAGGTVWGYLANVYLSVPWIHPGGDWSDADGTLQGSSAWATANISNLGAEQTISFDVTSLVQDHLSGLTNSVPNRGWIIKNDSGGISELFYSREYSDPTKRPNLHIVTSTNTYDLAPGGDAGISPSTTGSSHDADTTMTVGGDSARIAIYFDLSSVAGSVTSATLTLKTNSTQFGSGTSVLGVYPVDLTATFTPILVDSGIGANYTNDVGIENDSSVIFAEKFPDLHMENRGWWYQYFPSTERSIVGDTDPDDPNYKPLAAGVKAYKMTIPTGGNGGEFGRWSFWSNTGSEPNEVYMRVYARIGTDFDSEAGKFPFGFDGTYNPRTNLCRGPSGSDCISTNPATGRAWIRSDAPAYAGNGGNTSDGTNGWSARGGFWAEDCDSAGGSCTTNNPTINAGYRGLHFYTYWADQPSTYGSDLEWRNGLLGIIPKNHWVAIDEHMKLNTVNPDGTGNHDGVLEAWIDGRLAYSTTTLRERNWPGNAAGANNIKFDSVWLNLYHGGVDAAKSPMTVYLSDLVVSRSFVGPSTFDTSLVLDHANMRNQGLAAAGAGSTSFFSSFVDSIESFFSRVWHSITSFFHSVFAYLSGKSQLAAVTASVSSLDFGSVTVGQSATRTITLTVDGGGGVVVDTPPSSPGGGGSVSWSSSSGPGGGGGSISPVSSASSANRSDIHFTRTLYLGTKGTDVSLLQTYLSSINLLPPGNVSGFFGNLTRSAVQKFQCDHSIICSGNDSTGYGVLGPKTIKAITGQTDLTTTSSSAPATKNSTLALGSKGPAVTTLQQRLIVLKYLPAGSATGFFGNLTRSAVQKFQCAHKILCSGNDSTGYGVFGPKTKGVMGL